MTKMVIFDRLMELASHPNGGAGGGVLLACDMVHQEALYDFQDKLSALLLDVANDIGGAAPKSLCEKFPFAYTGNPQ